LHFDIKTGGDSFECVLYPNRGLTPTIAKEVIEKLPKLLKKVSPSLVRRAKLNVESRERFLLFTVCFGRTIKPSYEKEIAKKLENLIRYVARKHKVVATKC